MTDQSLFAPLDDLGTLVPRVLIANRGEIALRVIRTCARYDIETHVVYTAADADAPHVLAADEAHEVPSYLDIDAVVSVAVAQAVSAVHPGYGFLSERAAFARGLQAAGITLVGPDPDVMERMGRKDAAREVALAAGVPVVPAYDLATPADEMAYPVLVKAASGGGGKGMRVVRTAAELPAAIEAARRESAAAFGDDTLLIEKYVERGRHIEVQVMGDAAGTVLHFGERDCSVQRRHQKVLEEAPAPTLSDDQRAAITRAAVDLAREVGYVNAGTVEFLLDEADGDFYFLEMNTRLQVEHPVTEMVTGVDLVALQLWVAAGRPLPLGQDDVTCSGHAIEARIYAEDAYAGFLPQAGTADHVSWPYPAADSTGSSRVDAALESGQEVTTGFDPMLGKVIGHGIDRETALVFLLDALDRTVITGLTTNTGFCYALASSPEYRAAAIDTAWLDRHPDLAAPDPGPARDALAVVEERECWTRQPNAPWGRDGFRLAGERAPLRVAGETVCWPSPEAKAWPVRDHGPDARWRVELPADGVIDDLALGVLALRRAGHLDAVVVRRAEADEVVYQGHRYVIAHRDPSREEGAGAGGGAVVAPMPGTLLAVDVAVGDRVAAGDRLGVLEAMKMEVALTAPTAGSVGVVGAAAGDQVALGAVLFEVEEEPDAGAE